MANTTRKTTQTMWLAVATLILELFDAMRAASTNATRKARTVPPMRVFTKIHTRLMILPAYSL
jgi:hypothetical protein